MLAAALMHGRLCTPGRGGHPAEPTVLEGSLRLSAHEGGGMIVAAGAVGESAELFCLAGGAPAGRFSLFKGQPEAPVMGRQSPPVSN